MRTNVNGHRNTFISLKVHNLKVRMEEAYCIPQLSMSKIKLVSPPFKPSAYPHIISSFLQLTSPGLHSLSQRFRSLFFFFFFFFIICSFVCIRSWALRSSLQVCGFFGCCLAGSSSLTRNQTGLPASGKQALSHCTTREGPQVTFNFLVLIIP